MRGRNGTPRPHRATTVELRALYPFVVPEGLGVDGCYMGREASGELFCFDPWECYARGVLTSPNVVVFGQIGRGKSAFVKSLVWRQHAFGRQCWVLDPKGEYRDLAVRCGTRPLSLGPGMGLRLNPLDVPPAEPSVPASAHQRRSELLGALLGSSLGRPLRPEERAAADVALATVEGRLAVPVLPAVAEALLSPEPEHARQLGTDVEGLRLDGRQLALELRRLVRGDLSGMFDGPTTSGVDLNAGMVVLDLSRLYGSPALGLLMVCALSWLQSSLRLGGEDTTPGGTDPDSPAYRASALTDAKAATAATPLTSASAVNPTTPLTGPSAVNPATPSTGASDATTGPVVEDRGASPAVPQPVSPGPPVVGLVQGGPAPAKRLVVLDEAWAVLSNLATARWLQGNFKLARAYGVANVAVVHRVSDLKAAGGDGSEQQRLAEGLLSDAETRVVFGQAHGELETTAALLGLSPTERAVVGQLPRGVALWKVGQRTYLVEHHLSKEERMLADTDGAMG